MRKMWKDRRGLTLIELVCAIAILAIISATIGGAMVVATNAYRSGTVETALQQEAQFTINAIEALIIDATDTVEFTGNVLKIANVDYTYEIVYDPSAKTLRYTQYDTADPSVVIAANELLAEHVADFYADTTRFDTTRNVGLQLTMENEGKTFMTAYNITSRNNPDAGVPVEITATINVLDSIVLEPLQTYLLPVTVMGPANQNITVYPETKNGHVLASGTTFQVKPGGVEITIGAQETGGTEEGFTLWISTEARGADGDPLKRVPVTVKIRRVNDIDVTLTPVSGTNLKANAVYSVHAEEVGFNFNQVPLAPYDPDVGEGAYVDPRTRVWSFEAVGGTGNANDYVEHNGVLNGSDLVFKLKRDLDSGMVLKITATAQHPAGVNKTGNIYGTVSKTVTLEAVDSPLTPRDSGGLRRGDDCEVDANLDPNKLIEDEWKRSHPGQEMPDRERWNGAFTGWIHFRYVATDGTHASPNYPNWIKMSMQGSNPTQFEFKRDDFKDMMFMKDYKIEVLYSFKYNKRDNSPAIYPASAYPDGPNGSCVPIPNVDSAYIYTMSMNAFCMGFEAYEDGNWPPTSGSCAPYLTADGAGLGSLSNPMLLPFSGQIKLKFNVFTGAHVGKESVIESLMSTTYCQRWDGSNWQNTNVSLECKERWNKDSGVLQFEPVNRQMQRGVVYRFVLDKVKGENYASEPSPGAGGRGYIYVKLQ